YSVKPYILKYRYPIPKSVSIEIYCIFKYSSNLKLGGVGFHLPGGYAVIFRDGGHNKLTLRKGIESKEIPLKLNTCKPHFETDKYYKLRVDLNNFVIKLFVDDICVAETTTDNIPDDDNYIGFGVWNCDAIFKYIRITSPF
ncbi:MAG: hypothetical protein KJ844_04150, partial [Candidatus Edwardsbacteria bacterium]|nr:hypothetical protein [Candidatus Edwardsbacteria bacterium]